MSDSAHYRDTVHRETRVRPLVSSEERSILLRRSYEAPIQEVWAAWGWAGIWRCRA